MSVRALSATDRTRPGPIGTPNTPFPYAPDGATNTRISAMRRAPFFCAAAFAIIGASVSLARAVVQDDGAEAEARQLVLRSLINEQRAVFLGQVAEVGGASFADVPRDRATVVMRISQVFQQPARGVLKVGGLVTVGAHDLALLKRGRVALVFADPWIAGTGLAVQEIGSEIFASVPDGERIASLAREIQAASSAREEARLAAAVAASELVFACDVQEIRSLPADEVRPTRISEHAPLWKEAVVQVTEGLKGVESGETVVVRFASSQDVAWRDSPKFDKGESAFLMVGRDRLTGAAAHAKVNDRDVVACVAANAENLVLRPNLQLLRQLVGK